MAISVQDVGKRFGDFVALEDINLAVPDGSLTALLGPSGSGKSTLLRVIAGLETADSGDVFIGDTHATPLPAHRRDVGFVFQHYAAFKHMTVAKNIAFGLEIRKRPKAEVDERVAELITLVQLEGFGDRYPSQLSGGQRQRMALARALAVEPEVLLLDEPFGALDARVRAELRAWLRRLHDDMHVTTVFVTHDQEEAMEVADTVVVMNHGRIVQEGNPQEVYDHPADEFVMHFMGRVNVIGDAFVRPHDIEIRVEPNGTTSRAVVNRVLRLGAQVRVELDVESGETVAAELSRDEADRLPLEPGAAVFVRPRRERRFEPNHRGLASDGAPPQESVPASRA
jgi:sulfate transport system ATP-binding protein